MATVGTDVTVIGNVGRVYDLRKVGRNNSSVINFSIAVTPRTRNESGDWSDGETSWYDCSAWNKLAENIEKSFRPGDRVWVKGRVETSKKDDRTFVKIVAEHAGLDLIFDAAHSEREGKKGSSHEASEDRPARSSRSAGRSSKPDPVQLPDDSDDEMPF